MTARRASLAATLAVVLLALRPLAASATDYDMHIWVLPPTGNVPYDACLTDDWHGTYDDPGRALDWKRQCGEDASITVFFRGRAAAPDDAAGPFVGGWAEPVDMADLTPGCGTIHYAKVKIYGLDDSAKGAVTFQHFELSTSSDFDIWFKGAGDFHNAYFNNVAVGYTTRDSGCSTGHHVHENNTDTSLWVDWNTDHYEGAAPPCHSGYDVDYKENWTRENHWVDVV